RTGAPAGRWPGTPAAVLRDEPADPRLQPLGAVDPGAVGRYPATVVEKLQAPSGRTDAMALPGHNETAAAARSQGETREVKEVSTHDGPDRCCRPGDRAGGAASAAGADAARRNHGQQHPAHQPGRRAAGPDHHA
nr:hypothetical protein [Tanacetum cinerariifolium]